MHVPLLWGILSGRRSPPIRGIAAIHDSGLNSWPGESIEALLKDFTQRSHDQHQSQDVFRHPMLGFGRCPLRGNQHGSKDGPSQIALYPVSAYQKTKKWKPARD